MTSRVCQAVRAELPGLVETGLPRWRRRLVTLHVRRCVACDAELARERQVAAGLDEVGAAAASTADTPPDGLLDALLAEAEQAGVRGRVAVPARGAISGARPALSVGLLLVGAAAGTAVGYAGWRTARAAGRRLGRRR